MKIIHINSFLFLFLVSCSTSPPGNKDIRSAMSQYVEIETAKTEGNIEVMDVDLNKIRRLKMKRVHKRVGKTGDYFTPMQISKTWIMENYWIWILM